MMTTEGASHAADLASAYAHCQTELREADPDRFFAILFAAAPYRPALFALHAFSHEISRVRDAIRDPRLGEIRLQWWRDVLEGDARGDALANPVARALEDTLTRFRLPRQAIVDLIDARVFDLYDDPMPSIIDLEGYCGETSSSLMRLGSVILADGRDPGGAEAAAHAGVAYAITGLLRAFPWHAARGQIYIPKEILNQNGVTREDISLRRGGPGLLASLRQMRALARGHLDRALALRGDMAPPARAALLPLALVPAYLDRMERRDYDPFRSQIERPLWRKQITLWRAALRARR